MMDVRQDPMWEMLHAARSTVAFQPEFAAPILWENWLTKMNPISTSLALWIFSVFFDRFSKAFNR